MTLEERRALEIVDRLRDPTDGFNVYDVAQIIHAAENEALERAAQVGDSFSEALRTDDELAARDVVLCECIAAAIRALKMEPS